jgi:hypothetical protein
LRFFSSYVSRENGERQSWFLLTRERERPFTYLLELVGEGRGKHIGEELEGDGKEKLHERYDEENREGDKSK